jgi:hypothetical protein
MLGGCPVDPVITDVNQAAALTATAKSKFPRVIDLHQKIVARSCAPNTGVCHNTNNYPELATPASFLASINAWCNLGSPDPSQGFDLCERAGDVLISGSFRAEVARTERQPDGSWKVTLRDPAPRDDDVAPVRFESSLDDIVFQPSPEWGVTIAMIEGDPEVLLTIAIEEPFFTEPYIDEAMSGLVQGDGNGNGVFGADEVDDGVTEARASATVIAPGSLVRSYLWGRVTGTVPGSRMPLANEALSDDEYLALACFIEGLPKDGALPATDAAIDYDACAFAKEPQLFAIKE